MYGCAYIKSSKICKEISETEVGLCGMLRLIEDRICTDLKGMKGEDMMFLKSRLIGTAACMTGLLLAFSTGSLCAFSAVPVASAPGTVELRALGIYEISSAPIMLQEEQTEAAETSQGLEPLDISPVSTPGNDSTGSTSANAETNNTLVSAGTETGPGIGLNSGSEVGPGVGLGSSTGGPGASGPGATAQTSAGSGRVGINHASDASISVELGFKLVSPRVQRGSLNVAEGSVQLSDGSWAYIGHDKNIRSPYYRVLREVTDTQGVDWYVCAAHASKIGDYYTADGSEATELWLKKSDCTEQTSITLNTTNQTRINIVKTALSNLGDEYTYGMNGPDEFDCSGFVNYVFSQAGISVPRQSGAICAMAGQISIEDLRPGDIVGRNGHVGVYIGGGVFVHSSETSTGVVSEYVDVYNAQNGFTNYINAVGD